MIPEAAVIDELALELFIADNANQSREASIRDWQWFIAKNMKRGSIEHYQVMAEHVLAIGYTRTTK